VGEPTKTEPGRNAGGAGSGSAVNAGSARLFWAQVVGNAGLFIALLLLARALGPTGRGTIAFITVASKLVAWIARFGISEATVVFTAQRMRSRPALLTNLLAFSTLAGCAGAGVVCGGLAVAPSLRPPGIGTVELVALAAGIVAATLADSGYQFVLGCSRFRLHALVTTSTAWLYAVLIAALWIAGGLSAADAAFAWAGIHVIRAAVLFGTSAARVGLQGPRIALLVESMRFGLRAWIGTFADALNFRVDQILVAVLASEAALGHYAVAVNASEILLYLPAGAATALLPVIAGSAPELRYARTLDAFRSVALATTASVVLAAVAGPLLIPLVFGASFRDAVTPFLLLMPGIVGAVALAVFTNALVASALPGRSSLGPLASLVTGVALDVALIPPFGAAGAAAAASAAFLVGGGVALLVYRRQEPFSWRALAVPQRRDVDLLRALAGALPRRVRRA
jgi:O-antigen/teichoic acid export membrane protein